MLNELLFRAGGRLAPIYRTGVAAKGHTEYQAVGRHTVIYGGRGCREASPCVMGNQEEDQNDDHGNFLVHGENLPTRIGICLTFAFY